MVPEIFKPPPPPLNFVGRERELSWLERETEMGFSPAEPLAVIGPGGIGKTALVSFFCSTNRKPRWRERERDFAWIQCRDFRERREEFDAFIRADRERPERRWPFDGLTVVLDGGDDIPPAELTEAAGHVANFKLVSSLIVTKRAEPIGDKERWYSRRPRKLEVGPLTEENTLSLMSQLGFLMNLDRGTLMRAARGHPLTVTLLAGLVPHLGQEDIRRIIEGNIYGQSDFPAVEKPELIKVVRPTIISASEAMVEALKKEPDGMHRLAPRQFEDLVAELLRDRGWDVQLTPATRDGGKDILAYLETDIGKLLCLVEAKRYSKTRNVGVELVRTLYGTLCDYQANSAMMVTTSSFSKDARVFQKKHEMQLKLKDYTDVVGWIMKHGRRGGSVQ
jgi:restriction system protein